MLAAWRECSAARVRSAAAVAHSRQRRGMCALRSLALHRQWCLAQPLMAQSHWRNSRTARRLQAASVEALRDDVRDERAATQRAVEHDCRRLARRAFAAFNAVCNERAATQRAVEHDCRRLAQRALVDWLLPSHHRTRRLERLRAAALCAARRTTYGIRARSWRTWRHALAIRQRIADAQQRRAHECLASHWRALIRLCQVLVRARRVQKHVAENVCRTHLRALAAFCAHRTVLRRISLEVRARVASKQRARIIDCWWREYAAAAVAATLERVTLEALTLRCWWALKSHAADARREAQWQSRNLAVLSGALRADPSLSDAAFRCLARWRLLLISRALGTLAAHASACVRQRREEAVLAERARERVLRPVFAAWTDVVWHDQLMRRMRADLAAERVRLREQFYSQEPWRRAGTADGGILFGLTPPMRPAAQARFLVEEVLRTA